jgi:peroxiredoxin
MRKLICFLIIFLPFVSIAQETTISGNALFFKNEKIQVYSYSNLLAKEKTLLQETIVDDDGAYSLNFILNTPQVVLLKIEMRELRIHLHPETKIVIDLLPFENATNQRIPLKRRINYTYLPANIAADSVYQILNADFALLQLDVKPNTNLRVMYDGFFQKTDSSYAVLLANDILFKNYYTYFKANAYLQTSLSDKKLISKFLVNEPVLHQSLQYLRFFKIVMNSRLNNHFLKNHLTVESAKKEYQIYDALMNILETDSLLKDEETRSLALLLYTKSNSSNQLFEHETKAAIIDQISNFSSYPYQSDAARSFQMRVNKFKINQEAPIFELSNIDGEIVNLESFRGKPVYLGFIHSKSLTCQKDLMAIQTLQKKYRKATFLLIVSDRESVLQSKIPKETSNLHVLYLNKKYSVLEKYQIWNYPVYYLLDKHGYFIQVPAKKPNEMFNTFERMFASKSKRKRYEIIQD